MNTFKKTISATILFISASIGFSKNINKTDVVGLWILESFTIKNNKGIEKPWAEKIHGTLFYSTDNFMSVSINGTQGKSNKILFYSGSYSINSKGTMVHHVLNASDQNRINKNMYRKVLFRSGYLTLITNAHYGTAKLKWKRINMTDLLKSQ